MAQPSYAVSREIFFRQELDIALRLVKSALFHLQTNKLYKQNHFIFLMLLASGIERLTKIVLYLEVYEREGRYLERSDFKKLGHDIQKLVDLVVEKCFTAAYAVICIEKLLRALARLFVFGVLGDQGRRHSSILRPFANLEDNLLGKTTYE